MTEIKNKEVYDNMSIKDVIGGLQFTMDMFTFDPFTGEKINIDNDNEMNKYTYYSCKEAVKLLKELVDKVCPRCNKGHLQRIKPTFFNNRCNARCPECNSYGIVKWYD